MSKIVEMRNVERHYEGGRVRAVNGVDLSILKGEHIAVLGPSGSGKTSLLHLMGAIDYATSGTVRVLGKDILPETDLAQLRNQHIGFVFQLHNLLPHLTLMENVMLPLYPQELPQELRREKSKTALADVGLTERMDFLPTRVSGGERQRVAIARALVNAPQLVLADEPTGNLDSQNAEVVSELLRDVVDREQRTLVVVTHNEEYASQFDRIISLCDGKIASDSVISELKKCV